MTWLKDNRPLADRLMDRVNISASGGSHRLEMQHCREDDSGLYTARAENAKGNAHCSALLVVHECKLLRFLGVGGGFARKCGLISGEDVSPSLT